MLPPFVSLGRDEVVPIAFAALAVALNSNTQLSQ